jgi:hypothetical protein
MCFSTVNSTNFAKFWENLPTFQYHKVGGKKNPRQHPIKHNFFHAYISIWNNSQILENHNVESFRNTKCFWVHNTRIWKPQVMCSMYIYPSLKGF